MYSMFIRFTLFFSTSSAVLRVLWNIRSKISMWPRAVATNSGVAPRWWETQLWMIWVQTLPLLLPYCIVCTYVCMHLLTQWLPYPWRRVWRPWPAAVGQCQWSLLALLWTKEWSHPDEITYYNNIHRLDTFKSQICTFKSIICLLCYLVLWVNGTILFQ